MQYLIHFYTDALNDRMLDINTTAVIKCGKDAMLHLAKKGSDLIVNTASVADVRISLIFSNSTSYLQY